MKKSLPQEAIRDVVMAWLKSALSYAGVSARPFYIGLIGRLS